MIFRILMSAALLMLPATSSYALPPVYTLQTGAGIDDVGGDAENFIYLGGGALFSKGLTKNSIFDLQGELTTFSYPDNKDRSGEEIFLQGTLSYTPRAGFQVPTYSAGLRLREEIRSDSDRDATTTSIILSMSYRLDDRSSLLGGLKLDSRAASEDSTTTGVFVNFDYRYNPQVILYSTLNLASEDIDTNSSAVSGLPNVASRPFIGGHHTQSEGGGGGGNPISKSDNTYLTAGASWALTSANSLDLSVSYQEYDTDSVKVFGSIYSLDFFHRF